MPVNLRLGVAWAITPGSAPIAPADGSNHEKCRPAAFARKLKDLVKQLQKLEQEFEQEIRCTIASRIALGKAVGAFAQTVTQPVTQAGPPRMKAPRIRH